MFIGEYTYSIDDKKRLAVPPKFRKQLKNGGVVTRGLDNCLFLYSYDIRLSIRCIRVIRIFVKYGSCYNYAMENEIIKRLDEQKQTIEKIAKDVEKTKKYFLWTMILTIAFLVLPLIAMAFVIPVFMNNYLGSISNLGI